MKLFRGSKWSDVRYVEFAVAQMALAERLM